MPERVEREIVRKAKDNPRISVSQISIDLEHYHGIKLSVSRIRNVLNKSYYHDQVQRRKFWVSDTNTIYIKSHNTLIRIHFVLEHQNETGSSGTGFFLPMRANSTYLDRMAEEKCGGKEMNSS